jgi:Uma2 family endonuclease
MPIAAPRYTVDDLDRFPDDDQHYELLDGVLLVTPAPSQGHQAILGLLLRSLFAAVGDVGRVVSPGRIQSGKRIRLEPDVLVYPAPVMPDAAWTDVTEWWLAVEVLSPSTRVYDAEWKRQAYQALGVQSVCLVDPRTGTISMWEGKAPTPSIVSDRLRWTCTAAPHIHVDLAVPGIFV